MNNNKILDAIKVIRKNIRKNCVGKICEELYADCANCKGHILLGYLEWYKDLLDKKK